MLPDRLQAAAPRLAEAPFDSHRKRMTTVHRLPADETGPGGLFPGMEAGHAAFTKGAVDGLLALTTRVWTGERPEPTFLITKPFQRSTVKAAISQALFFDQSTAPVA